MANTLIIVESPAKVKTIKKFLGAGYVVEASGGHVRDLPKSTMGIDVKQDFEPRYITIRGKGDVLANLRKQVKKADKVLLATDPDREGEAISWHLKEALKLDDNTKRITFNEITKEAVKASIKAPRDLDFKLIDAQQARRSLDRIVGYSISPLLWHKVKRGLSAGRVQSATLGMIFRREEEINAFVPEEYWTLDAMVTADKGKKPFPLHYADKEKLGSKEEVDALIASLKDGSIAITEIRSVQKTRRAPLPYTTSTLQQDASRSLNFSPQKTMRIAQGLYENGVITYLRTDSVRVADEAAAAAKSYIETTFGSDYVGKGIGQGAKGKIQDAHEAIRPTNIAKVPEALKNGSRDEFRLYQLIWRRFAASRMADSVSEQTTVKAMAGGHSFTASVTRTSFDGFRKVYDLGEEDGKKNAALEKLSENSVLMLQQYLPEQHFTQPPAHFTEAALVHEMEEKGIGRPSTYAPTIGLLMDRHYITKEQKNLYITDLGEAVYGIMEQYFPKISNADFTATMESELDAVAEGTEEWKQVLRGFYPDFEQALKAAEDEIQKIKVEDEVTEVLCPQCGRNMVIKYGPHGKFLACPGFPACRSTLPFLEKAGVKCPTCGGEVIIRKTKKGRRFYGCENSPECDFMSWQKPKEG